MNVQLEDSNGAKRPQAGPKSSCSKRSVNVQRVVRHLVRQQNLLHLRRQERSMSNSIGRPSSAMT
jgi:hypothetical protein